MWAVGLHSQDKLHVHGYDVVPENQWAEGGGRVRKKTLDLTSYTFHAEQIRTRLPAARDDVLCADKNPVRR